MTTQLHCPDCGAKPGDPHTSDCDVQRCSVCGQQRITCDCDGRDPIQSAWNGECPTDLMLTDEQIDRQECVADAIHGLLVELAGLDLQWDTSLIGAVRDCINDEFQNRGIMSEMDFYPYLEEQEPTQ